MKTKRHWFNRRGDNYHYYEDDKYGLGHVIRRFENGRLWYDAFCPSTMKTKRCQRLKEAKRFVERNWKK